MIAATRRERYEPKVGTSRLWERIERRELLRGSVAVAGCCCAGGGTGCAAFTGKSKTPNVPSAALKVEGEVALIDLDKVPSLSGSTASVKFVIEDGSDEPVPVLVVRLEDRYEAYVNACTHGGREMEFLPKEQRLRCVSFGHSEFDIVGKTLSGPAQEDLSLLGVQKRGRTLAISFG